MNTFSNKQPNTQFVCKNAIGFVAAVVILLFPSITYAASLYFGPASGSYSVGEQFSINVFVSSQDQELNAVKATVSSSNGSIELVSILRSGSIIDFWPEEPTIVNARDAHFEGVILGGSYRGSSGKVATLIFRARTPGSTTLRFTSGRVLANDGLGTEIPTSFGEAVFVIKESNRTEVQNEIPEGFTFAKDLRQGDRGSEVSYLQICLRDQEFYDEDVTGFFGTLTRQAVIDFQEHYRDDVLAPGGFSRGTGQVGEATKKKLNEVCFVAPTVEEPEETVVEELAPIVSIVVEEAEEKIPFYAKIWFWIGVSAFLAMIIIFLLLVIIVLLIRKANTRTTRKHRRSLRKQELLLRKSHKDLLLAKHRVESDLEKIENRLKNFPVHREGVHREEKRKRE